MSFIQRIKNLKVVAFAIWLCQIRFGNAAIMPVTGMNTPRYFFCHKDSSQNVKFGPSILAKGPAIKNSTGVLRSNRPGLRPRMFEKHSGAQMKKITTIFWHESRINRNSGYVSR